MTKLKQGLIKFDEGKHFAPVCYNQLRKSRAIAPEDKRDISRETSWAKHMEEARYLEVPKKVRGILKRDQINTTSSTLTSVHTYTSVQHLDNPAVPQPGTPQPATPHAQDST